MKILLLDLDLMQNRPLTRIRSIFSLRDGIFTPIERIHLLYENPDIFFLHPDSEYEKLISEIEGVKSYKQTFGDRAIKNSDFDKIIESTNVFEILELIERRIVSDINLLDLNNFQNNFKVIGSNEKLYVHKLAKVHEGVIFDTRNGPIIIDAGTEITPFTYMEGTLYIGKGSKIDDAKISGPTVLGNVVRIGGEIENTIINDYSNKHHNGFVGHSIIGSWVNLGALSTTSDLKNNYGKIRIRLPIDINPHFSKFELLNTGKIKFGAIIGDCVKTAIGTMINTGTVIDCGSNIFKPINEKYIYPLSWGDSKDRYELEKFISDSKRIFIRRDKKPHINIRNLLELINGTVTNTQ